MYVSSPVVVVRAPSNVDGDEVVPPGTEGDIAESRFDTASSVTGGGVVDEARRPSFDCNFIDHSLALWLIPENTLGT